MDRMEQMERSNQQMERSMQQMARSSQQMERSMQHMKRSSQQMERSNKQMERSMKELRVENRRAMNIGPEMDPLPLSESNDDESSLGHEESLEEVALNFNDSSVSSEFADNFTDLSVLSIVEEVVKNLEN